MDCKCNEEARIYCEDHIPGTDPVKKEEKFTAPEDGTYQLSNGEFKKIDPPSPHEQLEDGKKWILIDIKRL